MVTINDAWKHVSNKIANKVNDPFEELFASVVPIDKDGNFLGLISSDCEEYEGDSYVMLRRLLDKTHLLPTGGYLYLCPCKVAVTTSMDEYANLKEKARRGEDTRRKALVLALVHPITLNEETGMPADVVMENGIYWLDTNEFDELPPTVNGSTGDNEETGTLPMALGALALKCSMDNGTLGEIGMRLAKALALAEQSLSEAEAIFESIKNN